MKFFQSYLKLIQTLKKAWYGKGLVLFSQEHYEEALEAFKQAVPNQGEESGEESKINAPELEDAWTKIGLAQLKIEKYEDACDTFEKVLEKKTDGC
ncbi:tetratricopeptide repeat protein [Methanosarcina horonobensis]|uniref:tetratricopeptide repeat protein n=1 Tax=Methanosarcina horonobensis TaxID=418008 RepID=UPI000A8A28EA|nr:tetratricopeptide repeat protein [Methanosarcina horonobensis]